MRRTESTVALHVRPALSTLTDICQHTEDHRHHGEALPARSHQGVRTIRPDRSPPAARLPLGPRTNPPLHPPQPDLPALRNELGDILLHVVLHATIAEQADEFRLRDVLKEINEKLIRRHPHVFGTTRAATSKEVTRNWEQLKMLEGRTSVLDGVPGGLPALQRALRVQERAAKVGFDWEKMEDVWKKVEEETNELREALTEGDAAKAEEEFGDFLFALVNYARFLGIHPENALRGTIDKFTRRFHYIEEELRRRGKDPASSTLAEMDEIWNEAKRKV
jgi:MazG family protein